MPMPRVSCLWAAIGEDLRSAGSARAATTFIRPEGLRRKCGLPREGRRFSDRVDHRNAWRILGNMASPEQSPRRKTLAESIFNVTIFFVAAILWVAFGAVLLSRQGDLTDLWNSFRGQHWLLQGIEFVLLLPWVIALWIWNTGWWLWMRIVLVLGLAWINLLMFWPWPGGNNEVPNP